LLVTDQHGLSGLDGAATAKLQRSEPRYISEAGVRLCERRLLPRGHAILFTKNVPVDAYFEASLKNLSGEPSHRDARHSN
jgi:hypothetical protein